MLSRRSILAGLIATPVVVKASSLMRLAPTEIIKPTLPITRLHWGDVYFVYGETACVTRRSVPWFKGSEGGLVGATVEEKLFFSCVKTGQGSEAEWVSSPPVPARYQQFVMRSPSDIFPNGEFVYA